MSLGSYRLEGKTPVLEPDTLAWALWFEDADTHVAKHYVGPYFVSTIFTGLDNNWGTGEPLLFESMVKNVAINEWVEQQRYHTWDEAEAGHCELVRRFQQMTLLSTRPREAGP